MFVDFSFDEPLDRDLLWGSGLSSRPDCRVCGAVRRKGWDEDYPKNQECKHALCPNCARLWGFQEFDRSAAVARYLKREGAFMYRLRFTADASPSISPRAHLHGALETLSKMQNGAGWLADRRKYGIYGVVRNVRDVVLPSAVDFSIEMAIWTAEALDDPEDLLDRMHERWSGALSRLSRPIRTNRDWQRIWRAKEMDGETKFLHSSGLSSRFGPRSTITTEMRDAFTGLMAGPWTAREIGEGSGRWVLAVPREDLPDLQLGVRDLAGSELPEPVGLLWRLEDAWYKRKRVGRTHVTKKDAKPVDAHLERLRRTWDRALVAPSFLRRPKAVTERATSDDLQRFDGDVWTGRVRARESEAEAEWERFWLRRLGLEPAPVSHLRRRTPADVESRSGASDAR